MHSKHVNEAMTDNSFFFNGSYGDNNVIISMPLPYICIYIYTHVFFLTFSHMLLRVYLRTCLQHEGSPSRSPSSFLLVSYMCML